jgi:hypothetical protein
MSAYLNAGMIDPYVMARAAEITAPYSPMHPLAPPLSPIHTLTHP